MRSRFLVLVLLTLAMIPGCNRGPKGIVRDPVTKVFGTLLIDGEPVPMVNVKLSRIGDADPTAGTSKVLTPAAFTNDKGKFCIGTYEGGPGGDGAPKGDYALLVQWGELNLIGGMYGGDKFKGKYNDPGKSEIKVTVADKPIDLGEIELTSN